MAGESLPAVTCLVAPLLYTYLAAASSGRSYPLLHTVSNGLTCIVPCDTIFGRAFVPPARRGRYAEIPIAKHYRAEGQAPLRLLKAPSVLYR